jgi:hypothetical protein
VTYTIAKLANELSKIEGRVLDLKKVWGQQGTYAELNEELSRIAGTIFSILYSSVEQQRNLTQWAKRQSCWEDVKNIPIQLSPTFLRTLVEASEASREARTARGLQQMDSGIDDQAIVLSLGQAYWQELLDWTTVRGRIAQTDERCLRSAAGQYGGLPTDRQCKRLLQVKKRCEEEGFIAAVPATS